MGVRKETLYRGTSNGTAFRKLNSSWRYSQGHESTEYREDITPAQLDKYFKTTKLTITGGRANGENSGAKYSNWHIPGVYNAALAHMSIPDKKSDALYATRVAAETNPSEPLVGVGVTLAELREIPKSIHRRGRDLYVDLMRVIRERGRNPRTADLAKDAFLDLNIRYQFGIKPIMDDLDKLLFLKKQIRQRVRDLLKTEKKGGLVKKRDVFKGSSGPAYGGPMLVVSDLGSANQWRARVETTTRTEIWVYCRWVPDGSRTTSMLNDRKFHQQLGSVFFGTRIWNMYNAWEALPWSWLVDWFFNLGDYLGATNNTVGVRLQAVCVCEKTITEQNWYFTDIPSGVTIEPCKKVLVTKERRPTSLDISPKLNMLNSTQLSILASIANK